MTTATYNTFLGYSTGYATTTGYQNTFVGFNVKAGNGSGSHNVIIGGEAGGDLWTGGNNTFIGHQTGAESAPLHHVTAIWADAWVAVSNAVILGNNANVGIGTSSPTARLEIVGGPITVAYD